VQELLARVGVKTDPTSGASWRDDAGSVTAEFALVAPMAVVLIAACVAALGVATESIRLADAAGVSARALGRGDDAVAAAVVERLAPGASMSVDRESLVCIRLERVVRLGPFPGAIPLSARSCAAEGGL
jgi:hypothetical protein